MRVLLTANKGFRTYRDVDVKSQPIFLPREKIEYDPKAVKKVLARNNGEGYEVLADVAKRLPLLEKWDKEAIKELLEEICRDRNVGLGKVAQPVRVAVTGGAISPSIDDTVFLLGQEETHKRIIGAQRLREEGASQS